MMQLPFTQTITTAFAEAVGMHGADSKRFVALRASLAPAMQELTTMPGPEAAAILRLPTATDDLPEIMAIAARLRARFRTLVVVGMGGSSLGGETLAQLVTPDAPALRFIDNIDPDRLAQQMASYDWPNTAFLVVSKSGGTVETTALMAILLAEVEAQGLAPAEHFVVITIANDNPFHRLAQARGMVVSAHDPDLCGRFSILGNVGLIPAAFAGVDIQALRAGAAAVLAEGASAAVDAAALHLTLFEQGVGVHVLMHYRERLTGLANWYRQCWAESLGKEGKGTIPVRCRGAVDQHSQLQLYLEGPRDKWFTALVQDVRGQGRSLAMPGSTDPRLDYLRDHTLGDLLTAEQRGTNDTLVSAGRPLRSITFEQLNARTFGALIMHFTLEVMLTARLMEVNAFDQPAVEAGKKRALEYLARG